MCVPGRLDYASTCVLKLQLGLKREYEPEPGPPASLRHLLMMRPKDVADFEGQSKAICVIVAENHINWPQCPLAFAPNQ